MDIVPCTLCGSLGFTPLFSASDYISDTVHTIVKCSTCGLSFVDPQPSKEELAHFYPTLYYGKEPFGYEKVDARSRFKQFSKVVGNPPGRLLDIGCGKGLLLKLFKDSGWEVAGTEFSENSARYGRETLGLDILNKDIEDCDFQDDYFDAVTLFHSLEHLTNPLSTLQSLRRLLKPDGILIIQVPRFGSFYSRIFKDKWFHLDVPRHLFHFEDDTLESLLKAAGFVVFKRKKYALVYDTFGALQSILNYVCSRMNLLNDMNTKRTTLKDILKSGESRLKRDAFISLSLQPLLFPPLFAMSAFLSVFNIGGTLTFCARK